MVSSPLQWNLGSGLSKYRELIGTGADLNNKIVSLPLNLLEYDLLT
jgi:hypothetical protein